jgi:inosine-uridine nucleoside N-ribohydrolase
MAKEKVILDTDIGSDIDDAVCLAYLLSQPECDLLGITTVTGEAGSRAEMASAMCRVAGRDIPIYAGAEQPLLVAQMQTQAQQAVALRSWPHQSFPKASAFEAVDFLRSTIRQHPGQVHLLTIGPLTNAGLLFAIDPEIPALLKSLTLMAGRFLADGREWNAMGDPHATAIVYRAGASTHRSIGLDVTEKVRLGADQVRRQFTAELLRPVLDFALRPVLDFAEVWFQRAGGITFHDPLAAVTLFDPQVCTFHRGTVAVDLSTADSAGKTLWKPDSGGPHAVAVQVYPQRFFEHYFAVVR